MLKFLKRIASIKNDLNIELPCGVYTGFPKAGPQYLNEDQMKERLFIKNDTDAINKIKESEGQRFARTQQEHLDTYESMRHKAGHELEHLNFDRASDAAKALDMSMKGEREVIKGMINLQFVQNVLSVLVEEINDEATLKRVAGRLKALIQTEEPALS